jgi:tetratricopeptide (TPR) repeat protein
MWQRRGNWLGALALAATFGLTAGTSHANTQADSVTAKSFSGAYLAARAAEADNDLDSAIRFYQRAVTFAPDDLSLQQSLMLALISRGRFDEALPHADKLQAVPEVERFSRLALGVDAFRQEDHGRAEYWLKLAVESDLDRLITGLMRGWAKAGQGEHAGALTLIDDLEGPEWYKLFKSFHRGLVAEMAGLTEQAEQAYADTLDNTAAGGAAPETYLRAVEAYAGFLTRKGEREAALEAIAKGLELSSNRIQLLTLRQRIEQGEAVEPLVKTVRDGAAEVLLDVGTALGRGGGEAFVRLYLQYAVALKPESDAILLQLAAVSEQQREGEEAIEFYRKVPTGSPLKRIAELQLGLNLADLDRHEEAIPHLTALVEQDPEDMRAYLALGGVHAAMENYQAAAEVYDRAAARLEAPTNSDWNIFYQRGIAYERLKEWAKAEPNFRKALELHPNQPQVLNYLGYSWVDMNMNLEEGLELIRTAVDLRPSDGYIVDSLGWAYYRLGRFEDAVVELERAVSLRPNDPILNDHLGDAYWRVGRKLEATFQWSHARDMEPEPDILAEIEKKLAEGLPPLQDRKKAAVGAPAPQVTQPEANPEARPDVEGKSELRGATETTAASPGQHTVRPGQSLWSIAAEILGDGNRYSEILDLNPQLRGDPGRIVPGQELLVPAGF